MFHRHFLTFIITQYIYMELNQAVAALTTRNVITDRPLPLTPCEIIFS